MCQVTRLPITLTSEARMKAGNGLLLAKNVEKDKKKLL